MAALMTVIRARLAVLLVLVVAGLAACGDDAEVSNEYVGAVNAVQTDFARRFDQLQRQIDTSSTPADDTETLGEFQTAIAAAVTRLREVEPPEEVEQQHARLVSEIRNYGTIIASAREEFDSDDPQEILAARTQLSTDVAATSTRINQAIDQINRGLQE